MSAASESRTTKENLVLSALQLFAERGIDAVSMRTINNAAGTRNASAVHYHFGSKLGIIEAIWEFVRGQLDAYRATALANLEQRMEARDVPSVREVMWAMITPYVRVHRAPGHGRAAIRFLARLQTEMNPEIQSILRRDPAQTAQRFDALLAAALPWLPDDIRRTRTVYCWQLMVHAFSDAYSWEETRFGNLQPKTEQEALLRFFDYLVGGLQAPVGDSSDLDMP